MTRTELINRTAEKAQSTKKDTEKVLCVLITSISEALARNEKVQLTGFGTFDVKKKAARVARNPRTGKQVTIAACKVPAFKPSKHLKELVNRKG